MAENTNSRNILRELIDVVALLEDDYEITTVDCEPEDTAIRITKPNSKRTLYIVACSDPDDTEMRLYDDDTDSLKTQCCFYDGALDDLTPNHIANNIRELI